MPIDKSVLESKLDRRDRILVGLLTLTCCAMAAACWWYYGAEVRAAEAAAMRTTFAVSEGKVRQIWNWRRERIGDGEVEMSASTLIRARHVLSGSADASQEAVLLREILQRMCRAFLYSNAALVDLRGELRLELVGDGLDRGQFDRKSRAEMARQANAVNHAVLSDLTNETRDGRPMMALTIPVRNQGAIILDIDPERFLYPYVARWPGWAQSAENLLVRREGNQVIDLSPRRYAPSEKPISRRPLHLRLPAPSELEAGWRVQGLDYRFVPVIATVRHVPDSPWYLVAKIDEAEVTAPLRRMAWGAALLTGLIALVNTAGGALIVRRTRDRRRREREALFYSVSNNTPAYLWMESADGASCFLNDPLCEFLRGRRENGQQSWLDSVHSDDRERVRALHDRARAQSRGYTTEARLRCLDDEYRMVLIEALPQFSAGRFGGFAGCLVDITDRRRAEEQLRLANASLQRELRERIRKEEEIRRLGARLIDAREEERKHLARELHDGLNQQIAGISIAIGNLKRGLEPGQNQTRGEMDSIHRRLVEVSEQVRLMSHELHPAVFSLRGLGAAAESCCDEFASVNHIEVDRFIGGSFEDVPSPIALCVYRILQEALRNVAKHAQADYVRVELRRSGQGVELCVMDEGAGFEVATGTQRTGLGLISMEERVRLAGGILSLESEPGKGTTLVVTIPLKVPSPEESDRAVAASYVV